MKKNSRIASLVVLSFALLGNKKKDQDDSTAYRCSVDNQTVADAMGRNAWAVKCGLLTPEREALANAMHIFVAFNHEGMPTDPSAPCQPGEVVGFCIAAGCLPADQRVMFSQAYLPIGDAFLSKAKTVTSLSRPNPYPPFDFQERQIESFIVGETDEQIIIIRTEGGHVLKATLNHPMVLEGGKVVPAERLKPGMRALMVGGAETISAITTENFHGSVYNIRPKSTDVAANIIIAEDFLTGSIRYQNEWAEDFERLRLREVD